MNGSRQIAYNTKISTNNLSADQILDALEVDMEFLKQEIALAEANELLKQNEALDRGQVQPLVGVVLF
jgi:hypothetical protein